MPSWRLPAPPAERRIERGLALVLMPEITEREQVLARAVEPALRANHLNVRGVRVVFDDETPLPIVADWVGRAEVIVADVSELNAAVLYVLGLCHGLRRCPMLIARSPVELPFDLGALRCLRYRTDRESLLDLRNNLTRAADLPHRHPPQRRRPQQRERERGVSACARDHCDERLRTLIGTAL